MNKYRCKQSKLHCTPLNVCCAAFGRHNIVYIFEEKNQLVYYVHLLCHRIVCSIALFLGDDVRSAETSIACHRFLISVVLICNTFFFFFFFSLVVVQQSQMCCFLIPTNCSNCSLLGQSISSIFFGQRQLVIIRHAKVSLTHCQFFSNEKNLSHSCVVPFLRRQTDTTPFLC